MQSMRKLETGVAVLERSVGIYPLLLLGLIVALLGSSLAAADTPAGSAEPTNSGSKSARRPPPPLVGGKGLGGALINPEKIAYSRELMALVKSRWSWDGDKRLRAQVRLTVLPTGQLAEIRIERSSGDPDFDESTLRAVREASPVPPPPAEHYADFRDIRFTFDPNE